MRRFRNPAVNAALDYDARASKLLRQIQSVLQYEGINASPITILERIVASDPTSPMNDNNGLAENWLEMQAGRRRVKPYPRYQFVKWLVDLFKRDPERVPEDLYKAEEYLYIVAKAQNKLTMAEVPRWANIQVTTRNFPSIGSLGSYLKERGLLQREGVSAFEKEAGELQATGDAQIMYQKDGVMFVDVLTEKAACALGKGTEWCTIEGAFHSYAPKGLIILYLPDEDSPYQRVQFTADLADVMDENDDPVSFDDSDFLVDYKEIAERVAEAVTLRLEFVAKHPNLFSYLASSARMTPEERELASFYPTSKTLPIRWIKANREVIKELFSTKSSKTVQAILRRISPFVAIGDLVREMCMMRAPAALPILRNYGAQKQDLLEMVYIPKNTYDFQDREVQLRAFEIGKYEVTVGLWLWVTGRPMRGKTLTDMGKLSTPVTYVSWFDCIEFCNELSRLHGLEPAYIVRPDREVDWVWDANGYRLPTEAEWEAAAAGGENYEYAGSDDPDEVAWYGDNSDGRKHPVGQKKSNGYGLYDMSGNVAEWVYDAFSRDPFNKDEHPD